MSWANTLETTVPSSRLLLAPLRRTSVTVPEPEDPDQVMREGSPATGAKVLFKVNARSADTRNGALRSATKKERENSIVGGMYARLVRIGGAQMCCIIAIV
jgi:hypothetical protein